VQDIMICRLCNGVVLTAGVNVLMSAYDCTRLIKRTWSFLCISHLKHLVW
jgi:hypothetical protein